MNKTLNEYQKEAVKTADFPEKYKMIITSLGLNGEAGEVAEKVKKLLRDNNGELDDAHRMGIVKELGDVLWYLAVLAHELGFTLQEVANVNIHKIQSRKERGVIHGEGDDR